MQAFHSSGFTVEEFRAADLTRSPLKFSPAPLRFPLTIWLGSPSKSQQLNTVSNVVK